MIQVGVASLRHVHEGQVPLSEHPWAPPGVTASAWGQKTHLRHSLKSSRNQARQSSKELLVAYDKALIFQEPINNSNIQYFTETSRCWYLF